MRQPGGTTVVLSYSSTITGPSIQASPTAGPVESPASLAVAPPPARSKTVAPAVAAPAPAPSPRPTTDRVSGTRASAASPRAMRRRFTTSTDLVVRPIAVGPFVLVPEHPGEALRLVEPGRHASTVRLVFSPR